MKNKLLITLIFLFALLFATFAESPTLKIGSFNMQILGATKLGRPNTLTVLASIAARFDIIALQEVGSNGSKASPETCRLILEQYIARVNEVAGSAVYAFVQGDQYAILYRTDRVKLVGSALYAGTQTFTYTPLIASFQSIAGNLDFSMLTVHTSPLEAKSEIPALKVAMAEVAALYADPDVIALGDYNADGSYYAEGAGEGLAGFEGYITGIPNSADTTIAFSSNTYDRVQMTPSMESDYTKSWGVVVFATEYQISACEGTAKNAGTEAALSDHYPVWTEFYTDRDTD